MVRLDLQKLRAVYLPQGVKLALGALMAILLSDLLGLKYSATAGVITILSILGTKRETLTIAAGRLLAYGAALIAAAACYRLMGFTVTAFAAFLFVYSVVCCCAGWTYALSLGAVLVSHFMVEKTMAPAMLLSETLLFLIGTGCGILVNLTLRADEPRMRALLEQADEGMKNLLIAAGSLSADAENQLHRLEATLREAQALAQRNLDNQLLHQPQFDLRYVEMRRRQLAILAQVLTAMGKIDYLPAQHGEVAAFFRQVAEEYRTDNDVAALLDRLDALLASMKAAALPITREEFEGRAILYYVLLHMRDFLLLKRQFHEAYIVSFL